MTATTPRLRSRVRVLATGQVGRVECVYGKGNRRQPTATEARVGVRISILGPIAFFTPDELEPTE